MWFVSERRKKSATKGQVRFLRKGSVPRREGRALAGKDKGSHIPASILLLWLLFFATLCYVAFFSLFFLVSVPQVTGMSQVSEKALVASIESRIAGKYLGIFPRRDFFLIRPHALAEHLAMEFPLLASVSVTRIFPDGLHVSVTERTKIILWCSAGSPQNTAEGAVVERNCFLIDEEGHTKDASRALLAENMPYALFITDTSGRAAALGETVFEPRYGMFVIRMNAAFREETGLALDTEFTTVSRFADEVRAKTSEGWDVYISSAIPLETSLSALKLLFEKELPRELRAKLSYIDLRAENRVYYAFRTEENVENPSDISPSAPTEEKKVEAEPKKKK